MAKSKILIIEDDPTIVSSLTILLKGEYEIDSAKNGAEGLEKVDSFKPDLIILDLLMPGVDGFEVCKQLKQQDKYKGIPVIALSSFTELYDMRFGDEDTKGSLPSDVYLTKPLDPPTLLREIKEQLNK
ncbi:MAG TPA: response regulator [bacterium]|nr:response regulator [bacterium]